MVEPDLATSFRNALSRFASGVIVVAVDTPNGPVGFTASAFTSVSLDPPLVLVCAAKKASAYERLVASAMFGISVLARRQEWVAQQFANRGADRFLGVRLATPSRVPLIDGALAHLECSRHALHDAGDHTIVVGRVLRNTATSGKPLVHYARAYGGFTPDSATSRDDEVVSRNPRIEGERA